MNFDGVSAIVTGGASGLGAATALRLAELGSKVTIFDLNPDLGHEVARSIGGHYCNVNVTDEAGVSNGLDNAIAAHGSARILVNCAGIGKSIRTVNRSGEFFPLGEFRRVIEVNLVGTFNVVSKFAARQGQIGQAAYAASKGGIVGMTLPIARDLAQLAIRVVTIAPGLFLTPILKGMP